ncbi:Beta-barrel assembly machine subunit BamB [Acinetobacter calcoaceticus]|uniref:Outer membrane protein assembly factor BamB n=1 Tax=Acinetobacter calcoaceticus TaxID=471 RepID=A0A4R1XIQ8_ACICA|nr:Beta-barrel assembly machine subunit BamB [Acinetobacter calcoaceticus]
MDRKFTIPFALAILSATLMACSSNKVKEVKVKPNPLPKLAQADSLVPVFSTSVAATSEEDPLRLQIDVDQGNVFTLNPNGTVSAFKGKQRLWEKKVSKIGLSSGVEAAQGLVIVGNKKGQLFALDQATGEQKWTAQLSGALISAALIHTDRAIVVANDGTVFAFDISTGQQAWTYKLPNVAFSLRGQAAPVAIDSRTVVVGTANGYVYAIDSLTGVPRMQRRVAISDGRSDVQRLIDIKGEPVISGQFLVSTSFQGQVTVMDLAVQQVVWSEDASSIFSPAVHDNKVFVSKTDGTLVAYDMMSGQKIWENDLLLNRSLSNPVALGNFIVVGDYDGVLHLIDPNSGQIVGRSNTSGEVRSLRVIDGQLLVATRKGALSIWQTR